MIDTWTSFQKKKDKRKERGDWTCQYLYLIVPKQQNLKRERMKKEVRREKKLSRET